MSRNGRLGPRNQGNRSHGALRLSPNHHAILNHSGPTRPTRREGVADAVKWAVRVLVALLLATAGILAGLLIRGKAPAAAPSAATAISSSTSSTTSTTVHYTAPGSIPVDGEIVTAGVRGRRPTCESRSGPRAGA